MIKFLVQAMLAYLVVIFALAVFSPQDAVNVVVETMKVVQP
tara:strand:- start:691 stop:813 length:123 start_codon:yes stop_codon:yes gene_type:complete